MSTIDGQSLAGGCSSRQRQVADGADVHCVQKKTPTHIFIHISMNYLWI